MTRNRLQLADGRCINIERRNMYSRRGNTLGQRVKITHMDDRGERVATTFKVFGMLDERAEEIALKDWLAEYPMQVADKWGD